MHTYEFLINPHNDTPIVQHQMFNCLHHANQYAKYLCAKLDRLCDYTIRIGAVMAVDATWCNEGGKVDYKTYIDE